MGQTRPSGPAVLTEGLSRLAALLGDDFELIPMSPAGPAPTPGSMTERIADTAIQVKDVASGIWTEVLVDAVPELSPAEADRLLRPRAELMHRLQSRAVLLVLAPWLSPRSRAVLDQLDVNYLDLTGNARLEILRPRVLVRLDGAAKDPWPSATSGTRSLSGSRAGRLVRWMVDVPPPYRVTDLAVRTGLSAGYVSRLIDLVDDLGLLRRQGRVVVDVDWVGLLRERAASTDLLRTNRGTTALAPTGALRVLDAVAADPDLRDDVTVTGTVAAAAVAPLAVGGQLMLYVPADGGVAARLTRSAGLLPTEEGGNVVLLTPFDPVVTERRRTVAGLWHVALGQLALDCLSGPDRLPAAGESVLQKMIDTEQSWRRID